MKLPSFQNIVASAINACKRFPFMIACAVIGVFSLVAALERTFFDFDRDMEKILFKIGLFSGLGCLCLISSVLFAESRVWKKSYQTGIQIILSGLVIAYFFLTPSLNDFTRQQGTLFFLLCLTSLLFISIASFINKSAPAKFWEFNRKVISRFFTSAFFGFTLFGGLSLALLAIHFLFNIKIDDFRYGQLFFIFFFLFGVWYFVAGIPKKEEFTVEEENYPKGLKLFTQYVLIPLVAVYFIILYAYAIRILVLWELPQGWVSYLVLALSGVGILSFLFIWPLRDNQNNAWIKIYFRYFFIALAPLSVLLYVAILRRIGDYGITPNRYYVFISSVWVGCMIFYFIFSNKKNIKLIPASLAIIAFLSGFGPWGAHAVSEKSQMNRLDEILLENNAFINGQPDITKTAQLNDSICVEINQILYLLDDGNNGLKQLEKRWNMNFIENENFLNNDLTIDSYSVAKILNLKTTSRYYYRDSYESKYFYWYGTEWNLLDISDYNYMMREKYLRSGKNNAISFKLQNTNCKIYINEDNKTLILEDGDEIVYKSIKDYIKDLRDKGYESGNNFDSSPENKSLDFELNTANHRFSFLVSQINGEEENGVAEISNMNFVLLIKNK